MNGAGDWAETCPFSCNCHVDGCIGSTRGFIPHSFGNLLAWPDYSANTPQQHSATSSAPERARYHMIKSQILCLKFPAAILTGKSVTQKDIKAGERRIPALLNVILQCNHTGQPHRQTG